MTSMELRRQVQHPGAAYGFPIPQSVVLVLLYVGLLRLASLHWSTALRFSPDPTDLQALLFSGQPFTLLQFLGALNLVFVIYLWLDYRMRSAGRGGTRSLVWVPYLGASLLLLDLSYAYWQLSHLEAVQAVGRIL